ncbi:hypothetical protein A2291_08065 [candidate division WOR-1 bacterium RIFOXYB2_FULL_42_35]|uniref:Uncharacterized protein n=1 Tax=candidate division WOR-1 bacterium RIFOXYC2_FULL_41_25 TaxID=1802586 RepID=A0A1F4TIB2_UNCSA|nr:MAG: hypothetical protein A2247_01975 [candidate division WOR-1 bacterium RIFOXYA2_FULL_41_14]OGC24042.1 MAG: hypothetical protein A2291_08065 [candidate division WOR-1 bacterium RIFOXYB2_FULL_42_35]OGC32465.1 MAG: hypothetical protein A2462_00165 [candidate division WOR-1 bacterium RIFOXYC2_FULL_41_25]OGC44004.1 MAG: hypothetical protein A2548_00195 [candidate division WOR-1 bacterium RIFOXYD2_FULL_41_8]
MTQQFANQQFMAPTKLINFGKASMLKTHLKTQNNDFIDVLAQMAKGEEVEVLGQKISMKDNLTGAILAVNKFMADTEAVNTQLWKIFNMEQKLMDEMKQELGNFA